MAEDQAFVCQSKEVVNFIKRCVKAEEKPSENDEIEEILKTFTLKRIVSESHLNVINFVVHPHRRKELDKTIELVKAFSQCGKFPGVTVSKVPFEYTQSIQVGKRFLMNQPAKGDRIGKLGMVWKIDVEGIGSIEIGADSKYWNPYTTVRVTVESDQAQDAHKLLSYVGLPMALLPSREVDTHKQNLVQTLIELDPVAGYEANPEAIEEVLEAHPDQELAEKVRADASHIVMKEVWKGHAEPVNPLRGKQAWEAGGRGFGTTVVTKSSKETANVLASILRNGYLPSLERFRQGMFNLGCAPVANARQGSADSCFLRPLPQKAFNDECKFEDYPDLMWKTKWGAGRVFCSLTSD